MTHIIYLYIFMYILIHFMLVKWTLQLYKNSFQEYTNILNKFWLVQIKTINVGIRNWLKLKQTSNRKSINSAIRWNESRLPLRFSKIIQLYFFYYVIIFIRYTCWTRTTFATWNLRPRVLEEETKMAVDPNNLID